MDLTEDEKVVRGLLQFFLCADARRPSKDAPLKLKYRDLILTAYEGALKRKDSQAPEAKPDSKLREEQDEATAQGGETPALLQVSDVEDQDEDTAKGGETQALLQVSDVEDQDEDTAKGGETQALLQVSDVEEVDADAEGIEKQVSAVRLEVEEGQLDAAKKTTAQLVAEAVDATEAAEAAEAEVEAIMREEVLRRALLDPEGDAKRRRIQARKLSSRKGLRWNFTGRSAKAANDRYREHEADLETRRKLAFRSRRFRGQAEDQGDERQLGNLARQREVVAVSIVSETAARASPSRAQQRCLAQKSQDKAQRHRRRAGRAPKRRRLPPIDFPELPILIADHEDQEMFPALAARRTAPLAAQSQRNCRKARVQELESLRGSLTQELQKVQKERQDAARDLRQSCVAEAEAVEDLQNALTAAFGMVID